VKAKARLRLEMASDRLARQLLNMTSDPNVADPVKLAAIKDALDRGGIQSKTAVSVEVGVKPFEMVFDKIGSGPRTDHPALAIEAESLDQDTDNRSDLSGAYQFPDEIEADENEIDAEVVDVVEELDEPGTTTPTDPSSSLSVELSPAPGALGSTGPAGSGLMTLEDAVAAQEAMRSREAARAARVRDLRRR